jgi:phosphatidylserine/phosphatidylglycerophosphate/cardiolipin synthase-like enzyme
MDREGGVMANVVARAYLSPSLVLLAMDWEAGETRQDFLGFAIERTPGFRDLATNADAPKSWLPNRLDFNGPPASGQPDFPSNVAPIQKFMWWDARLEGRQPGQPITYEITPVCGQPGALQLITADAVRIDVALPAHEEMGIGTWFNRAVMSSQAFSRKLKALNLLPGQQPTDAQKRDLRTWLANGMEKPVPGLIGVANPPADSVVGAIYHLSDDLWIVPALNAAMAGKKIGLVYDAKIHKDKNGKVLPNASADAIKACPDVKFFKRDKTNIMHNKFLIAGTKLLSANGSRATTLTCGSANYTTQGLTQQANLVHTFESEALAALYLERFRLIKGNPTKADTKKKQTGWSPTVSIGDAGVRLFFSPEPGQPGDPSTSIETIVQAVHAARSSVVFCLFMPTDALLRQACFAVGDAGKMMFGLVNVIPNQEPTVTPTSLGNLPADEVAALELYHRSKNVRDVIDAEYFSANNVPAGFDREINVFPGENPPPYPPVIVHHKFVVIDAETDSPVIYTGSANMSGNAVFHNDENLLEIKGSPRLARIYLAEFLRLYEHYRARARYIAAKKANPNVGQAGFKLAGDAGWARKHFDVGSPEYKARKRLLAV